MVSKTKIAEQNIVKPSFSTVIETRKKSGTVHHFSSKKIKSKFHSAPKTLAPHPKEKKFKTSTHPHVKKQKSSPAHTSTNFKIKQTKSSLVHHLTRVEVQHPKSSSVHASFQHAQVQKPKSSPVQTSVKHVEVHSSKQSLVHSSSQHVQVQKPKSSPKQTEVKDRSSPKGQVQAPKSSPIQTSVKHPAVKYHTKLNVQAQHAEVKGTHHQTTANIQVPKPKSSAVHTSTHASISHAVVHHLAEKITKKHEDAKIESKPTKGVHSLQGRFEHLDTLLNLSLIHKKHAIQVAKYLFHIGKLTANTGLKMVLAQQRKLQKSKGNIEGPKNAINVGRRVMNIGKKILGRAINLLKAAVEDIKNNPNMSNTEDRSSKPNSHLLPKDFRLVMPIVKMVSLCSHSPIHSGLTLRGGFHSGKFFAQGKVKNMQTCIKLCCARENCDLAFMVKKFCYSVSCYKHEMCKSVDAYHVTKYHPQVAYVFKVRKAEPDNDEVNNETSKLHGHHSSTKARFSINLSATTMPTKSLASTYSKYIKKLIFKVSDDVGNRSHSKISPSSSTSDSSSRKTNDGDSEITLTNASEESCPRAQVVYNIGILGGLKAGNYTYFGETNNTEACIKNCCSRNKCDIAFMLDNSCYGIECFNGKRCRTTAVHNSRYNSKAVFITRRFNKEMDIQNSEFQREVEQTAKEKLDIEKTVNFIENALNLNDSATNEFSNVDRLLERKIMHLVHRKVEKPTKSRSTKLKDDMASSRMSTMRSYSPYPHRHSYLLWNMTSVHPSSSKRFSYANHGVESQTSATVYDDDDERNMNDYNTHTSVTSPPRRYIPTVRLTSKVKSSYYSENPSYSIVGVLPSTKQQQTSIIKEFRPSILATKLPTLKPTLNMVSPKTRPIIRPITRKTTEGALSETATSETEIVHEKEPDTVMREETFDSYPRGYNHREHSNTEHITVKVTLSGKNRHSTRTPKVYSSRGTMSIGDDFSGSGNYESIGSAEENFKSECQPMELHEESTLKAGYAAGNFTFSGNVNSTEECQNLCCADLKCDVAFIVLGKCFKVKCMNKTLCEPVKARHSSFKPVVVYMHRFNQKVEGEDESFEDIGSAMSELSASGDIDSHSVTSHATTISHSRKTSKWPTTSTTSLTTTVLKDPQTVILNGTTTNITATTSKFPTTPTETKAKVQTKQSTEEQKEIKVSLSPTISVRETGHEGALHINLHSNTTLSTIKQASKNNSEDKIVPMPVSTVKSLSEKDSVTVSLKLNNEKPIINHVENNESVPPTSSFSQDKLLTPASTVKVPPKNNDVTVSVHLNNEKPTIHDAKDDESLSSTTSFAQDSTGVTPTSVQHHDSKADSLKTNPELLAQKNNKIVTGNTDKKSNFKKFEENHSNLKLSSANMTAKGSNEVNHFGQSKHYQGLKQHHEYSNNLKLSIVNKTTKDNGKLDHHSCEFSEPHHNLTFRGGQYAGRFELLAATADITTCTHQCCEHKDCDVVLLLGSSCFMVKCKSRWLCEPVPALKTKYHPITVYRRARKEKEVESIAISRNRFNASKSAHDGNVEISATQSKTDIKATHVVESEILPTKVKTVSKPTHVVENAKISPTQLSNFSKQTHVVNNVEISKLISKNITPTKTAGISMSSSTVKKNTMIKVDLKGYKLSKYPSSLVDSFQDTNPMTVKVKLNDDSSKLSYSHSTHESATSIANPQNITDIQRKDTAETVSLPTAKVVVDHKDENSSKKKMSHTGSSNSDSNDPKTLSRDEDMTSRKVASDGTVKTILLNLQPDKRPSHEVMSGSVSKRTDILIKTFLADTTSTSTTTATAAVSSLPSLASSTLATPLSTASSTLSRTVSSSTSPSSTTSSSSSTSATSASPSSSAASASSSSSSSTTATSTESMVTATSLSSSLPPLPLPPPPSPPSTSSTSATSTSLKNVTANGTSKDGLNITISLQNNSQFPTAYTKEKEDTADLTKDKDKTEDNASTGNIMSIHATSPSRKTPLESNFRENILSVPGKSRKSDIVHNSQTKPHKASGKSTAGIADKTLRHESNQTVGGKRAAFNCEVGGFKLSVKLRLFSLSSLH